MAHSFVFGKIEYVNAFPDYKVKVVRSGYADLYVKETKRPGKKPGEWKVVKNFADYKVKKVKVGHDFSIRYVKHFPRVKRKVNYSVAIHSVDNRGKTRASFFGRKIGETGILCLSNVSKQDDLTAMKLIILVLDESYIQWAASNRKLVKNMITKANVLPVVTDMFSSEIKNWDVSLRPVADRFYIKFVSGYKRSRQYSELVNRVAQITGLTRKKYFLSRNEKGLLSTVIEKTRPYLYHGFTDKVAGAGAGGIFEASDTEVPDLMKVTLNGLSFWVSADKTHFKMIEWRVYLSDDETNRVLVTSNLAENVDGWTFDKVFYAPGVPSLGDEQRLPEVDGKHITFHVFNSHDWGVNEENHDKVMDIHEALTEQSIISWVDEEDMNKVDAISDQVRKAIFSSAITVVYVTEAYIDKCSHGKETDNVRREFLEYKSAFETEKRQLIFVMTEYESEIVKDTSQWGVLEPLAKLCPVVSLESGTEALSTLIKETLNLKPALYYISTSEERSAVNQDGFNEEEGFEKSGGFGAGSIFEAFEEPAPGMEQVIVEGATFYVTKRRVSKELLEWRVYKMLTQNSEFKYLITGNLKEDTKGWTYVTTFFARGKPCENSSQYPTL